MSKAATDEKMKYFIAMVMHPICLVTFLPYSRDYKYPSIIRTPQIQVPI